MANMQIYGVNLFNTTTMISTTIITNFTSTISNLFDRNENTSFSFNIDATVGGFWLYISPSSSVDAIIIKGLTSSGISQFSIYSFPHTATAFFQLANCQTSTSSWSSIPSGDLCLLFLSTTTIDTAISFGFYTSTPGVTATVYIDAINILTHKFTWPHNPSSKNYKQKYDRTEYKHKMSDGGSATYIISDNFVADIKDEFLSTTSMNELLDIYKEHSPITFIPFPTGTGWNGQIYECNWVDDFEFDYSDNYTGNGHDIRIKLEETAK
jgi:hypothetical protein